jgi:hypothetical protein
MTIEPTRRSTTRGRPRVTTGDWPCSRCERMVNTLRAFWPGEGLCHSCFYSAMRNHGIYRICGHDGRNCQYRWIGVLQATSVLVDSASWGGSPRLRSNGAY